MQEIYSMILNTSITTVITVIFLWQYVSNIKDDKKKDNENNEYLKKITENTQIIAEYLQGRSKKK